MTRDDTDGADDQHRHERVYLDSSVLSTLARTDSVEAVVGTLGNARTSYVVRGELREAYDAGYTYLGNALTYLHDPLEGDDAAADGASVAVAGSLVRQRKPELFDRLSADEASVLYQAWAAGAPLATDDRDVRAVARSYGVPVTGSLGLLVRAVEAENVGVETADEWLATWRTAGVNVPVGSVGDLLE